MSLAWLKKLSQSFSGAASAEDEPFEKDRDRLFAAARRNDAQTVDDITQKYPDEFAAWKGKDGTALAVAQTCGSFDAFKLLIERGCDIDENYGDSWTPLLRAIQDRQPAFVDYLIGKGANLDNTAVTKRVGYDIRSMSALHFAIKDGDKKLLVTLLEHGADPDNTAFSSGTNLESPVRYAEKKKQFVLADLLKRADKLRAAYLAKIIPSPRPATAQVAPDTEGAAPGDDGKIAVLNPLQLKKTADAATGGPK